MGTLSNDREVGTSVVQALALYSLAEFESGNCKCIDIEVAGHSFAVADDGRGHAIERNIAGRLTQTLDTIKSERP